MKPAPLALVLGLAAALPAAATDLTQMSDAERAAFGAEVRSYLLDNPQVIVEVIDLLQAQQAEAQAAGDATLVATNATDIFEDGNSWVGGNPEGDIVMVEFLDYRCGYCRKANAEVAELIQSDGNIRFIVKEFPILGEQSMISSRFAIAVRQIAGDDAYKDVHDRLITLRGDANPETLGRMARDMGLDAEAILAQMNTPEVTAIIEANHQLAQRLQINGTPAFILGDQMLRGYVPLDDMRKVVTQERG